jgi:phosphatidylcholine synthase
MKRHKDEQMRMNFGQSVEEESWLEYSARQKLLAWGVHLFTASGAVWGLLAVVAIIQYQWLLAFIWMGVAVMVDGLDGTLARIFKVKGALPGFDGALLDNIIDYLNYVIVPALFLYVAGLVPDQWALPSAGLMALASAYQFCQSDAKTEDHYYKGFPSYWNVAVFYLYLLGLSPWINLGIITALSFLVFVPIKYIYPSRMVSYRRLTIALTLMWGALMVAILAKFSNSQPWLVWFSLLYVVYYVAISFYMVWRQKREAA